MKTKIFNVGLFIALLLLCNVAIAMRLPPHWQFAYRDKDNGAVFYFNTNTLHTIETNKIDDDPTDDDDVTTTSSNTTSSNTTSSSTADTAIAEEENIIGVEMKTVLSAAALQELIDTYKGQYDTTGWSVITYSTSYNIYNRTDKTLITKNLCYFNVNNRPILTLNTENKSTVRAKSTESKVYDNIVTWMDEN
ncbi:MAG: hypothetical protein WCS30_07020 [Selenomonadaceae bacterium]